MTYLTRLHLSRRALLRGIGVSVALPLLDAMVPANTIRARPTAVPALRVGFCYVPHGAMIAEWTPAGEGTGPLLSRNLAPLKNVRDQVVVLTNLHLKTADGHDGLPRAFFGGGAGRKTIDQIIAGRLGQDTALLSVALGTEDSTIRAAN